LPATRSCNTDRGAWKIRCICMALSALLLASLFRILYYIIDVCGFII
jgi:hypothetical protein